MTEENKSGYLHSCRYEPILCEKKNNKSIRDENSKYSIIKMRDENSKYGIIKMRDGKILKIASLK